MSNDEQSKFSSITDLPFLKGLEPLSFAKFPSLAELAENPPQPVARREVGMFEALLNNPQAMLEDLHRSPEKYDQGVRALLTRLSNGESLGDLTPTEMDLLNRATLDFAQTPRQKAPAPSSKTETKVKPAKESAEEKSPKPVPGKDVPVTEMPPFWWVD